MFYSVPLDIEINNTMTLSGLVSYRILMFNYKSQAHFKSCQEEFFFFTTSWPVFLYVLLHALAQVT